MPVFRPGKFTAVMVDKVDASPYLNTSDWARKLGLGETTHYGSTAKEFIVGLGDSTLNLAGLFDATKNVQVAAPVLTLGATSATGGTLPAGATYWVVTGLNANGETTASNEVTATLTGTTSSQALTFTNPAGLTGIRVWRGTAPGAENVLVATPGLVTAYTDTNASTVPGSPPTANTTAGLSLDQLSDAFLTQTGDYPVTMMFDGGVAVGRRCAVMPCISSTYAPGVPVANTVTMKLAAVVDGRPGDGWVLTDGVPITGATTTLYTGVDNGVSPGATTTGGYAAFHVVANTWTGVTTLKIQHSVDNAVWVDLITQNVPASTVIAYPATVAGTVNRYLRATVTTAAGAGSIKVIAAFART